MATFSNPVNPLFADIPIVNPNGTPTFDFMRKWAQQGSVNTTITDLTTAAGVSAVLDIIGKAVGDLLVRGTFTWGVLAPNTAGFVLTDGGSGAISSWQQPHYVIAGGTTGQVLEKNSNADYDLKWATPSGGGAPASIKDDGTNVYIGVQDSNGQLVLDSFGDPIFTTEVLPASALPNPSASSLGGVQSKAAVSHQFLTSISTLGVPALAQPAAADLSDYSVGSFTPIDASGAGLTFGASTTGHYIQLGKLCYVYGFVQMPTTASVLQMTVGGLPFTVSSLGTNGFPLPVDANNGLGFTPFWFFSVGTTTAGLGNYNTGAAVANAAVSGAGIYFACLYPTA